MNCHSLVRLGALFCLLVVLAGILSGCAAVKQYSVDSWRGPLPMNDYRYVDAQPQ